MVQFDASIVCPVFFPPLPIETAFVKILGEQGKKWEFRREFHS